jgi:hypothetical protein
VSGAFHPFPQIERESTGDDATPSMDAIVLPHCEFSTVNESRRTGILGVLLLMHKIPFSPKDDGPWKSFRMLLLVVSPGSQTESSRSLISSKVKDDLGVLA